MELKQLEITVNVQNQLVCLNLHYHVNQYPLIQVKNDVLTGGGYAIDTSKPLTSSETCVGNVPEVVPTAENCPAMVDYKTNTITIRYW